MSSDINFNVFSAEKANKQWGKIKKSDIEVLLQYANKDITISDILDKRAKAQEDLLFPFYTNIINYFKSKGFVKLPCYLGDSVEFENDFDVNIISETISYLFTVKTLVKKSDGSMLRLPDDKVNEIKNKYENILKQIEEICNDEKGKQEVNLTSKQEELYEELYDVFHIDTEEGKLHEVVRADLAFGTIFEEDLDSDFINFDFFNLVGLPIDGVDAFQTPGKIKDDISVFVNSFTDEKFEKIVKDSYKHNNVVSQHFKNIDEARNILREYIDILFRTHEALKKYKDSILVITFNGKFFPNANEDYLNERGKEYIKFFK